MPTSGRYMVVYNKTKKCRNVVESGTYKCIAVCTVQLPGASLASVMVLGQSVRNIQPTQTLITDFWRVSDMDGQNSSNGVPSMWMVNVGKQYADFGLKKKRKSDGALREAKRI